MGAASADRVRLRVDAISEGDAVEVAGISRPSKEAPSPHSSDTMAGLAARSATARAAGRADQLDEICLGTVDAEGAGLAA